ncbi:MAG: SDR family oxidoreductase, partial [Pseudomonadota bacterium]
TIRGAVASWSKTLATELAADGITVNNVLPGFTDTERLAYIFEIQAKAAGRTPQEMADAARGSVPAARFAKPEEQGAAIAFLASPLAAYITGVNLPVDGGRTRSL